MEQARQFVRANKDRPFFLYVPTTVPHVALQVPDDSLAEYRGKWPDPPYLGDHGLLPNFCPRATYAAMITRMDGELGRLVQLVRELGLEDRTLFVFSSDNGPLPDRLGGADTEFFASDNSFRGRKASLYEGGIREPLAVRWKGHMPAGVTSDRVTGFEDWLPTLLELAGAAQATPRDIDGISFATVLRGGTQPERPFLYREFPSGNGQQMVRIGDWVGVRQNLAPRKKHGLPFKTELYNLKDDVGQEHDIAAAHPDIVAKIEAIMEQQHTPSKVFPLPGIDPLSATAAKTPGGHASAAKPAGEPAAATGNRLRNAGFELDSVFNGSPMRQGTEFVRAINLFQNRCPPPPCEGWWIEGNSGEGVSWESKEVHSGLHDPDCTAGGKRVSLVSAPEASVPAGPLVLSAWVRTTAAKALLELELVAAGARSDQNPRTLRSLSRRQMPCRRTPRSGAESRWSARRRLGQPRLCGWSSSAVASWPTICNWRLAASLRPLTCVRKSGSGSRSRGRPSHGFPVGWRKMIRRESYSLATVPTPRSTATWRFGSVPGRNRNARSWPH